MILSSLSLISTYIFYRALELEQLNEMKPQLKPDQISQIVNDEIEVLMMSSRNNNNNNLYNKNNKQYKFTRLLKKSTKIKSQNIWKIVIELQERLRNNES